MRTIIIFALAVSVAGCSTVNITYNLTGDGNTLDAQGRVVAPKEISTSGSAYGDAESKGGK